MALNFIIQPFDLNDGKGPLVRLLITHPDDPDFLYDVVSESFTNDSLIEHGRIAAAAYAC